MSAKLAVPSGILLQLNAGDTSSPACEYFTGMTPPSGHAVDVSVIT